VLNTSEIAVESVPTSLSLETLSGLALGKRGSAIPAPSSSFLERIVNSQPATREIHIIADSLSAQKTTKVTDFLTAHPNVQMHYTPT
jgi:hypothetical protein